MDELILLLTTHAVKTPQYLEYPQPDRGPERPR